MELPHLGNSRSFNFIRENLGLKIGLLTGSAILLIVLLLVGVFGTLQTPLISKLSLIQILLVMGILVAAFSMLLISIATTLMIQRPLNRLMEAFHQAESGDLCARAKVDSKDEIGQVATQFNDMLMKINGLEQNRIHAEHQLTVAQEELRYQSLLEEKAAVITSTNRRLEKSLKELSILFNISQSLSSSIEPDELCNKLGEVILKNMEVDDFAILVVDEETQRLEVKAARGFAKNDEIRALDFDFGEGVCGQVAKNRESVYIPDTSQEEDYLHYKGIKPENGSFFCLPIIAKDKVLGVINFSRVDIDAFSRQEMRMLAIMARQVAIALENARLYAKTKELSLTDDLTQVFNRRHFHNILEMEIKRAKRFGRQLSLLMVDVDHFKKFNDSYGHVEGDHLLVELAKVFKDNLREVDAVARYGGEEFAIVLPNTEMENAFKVGMKLRNFIGEIKERRSEEGRPFVSVSIGVSTFPADAESADDLINQADIALYQAKAQGRNRVISFSGMSVKDTLRVVE